MTDVEDKQENKEAKVLTDVSLINLSRAVKQGDLQLYMLLNIPTVEIIRLKFKNDEQQQTETGLSQKLLLYWKAMRNVAKEGELIRELEAALGDSGQQDIADIVSQRHQINQEIVPELFVSA
ncbi:hypothetical protein BOX15_Mlig013760g1 [Macrostomum lignano]|uniref:Death domain-containing protein n=1 Tax=Macrostomum lignano TaxID=282301 RepID=A0A267EAF7_9PLAT|nr:hypothetical protein BOX15_Mlig013760g1 [Macrostomum lignano]